MEKIVERYRYPLILLRELVRTDFKLRYQGSVLGFLWSLLRPLLTFVILYLVFTVALPVGKAVPNYPQYLLLGIILWNFFGEITSGSVGAIIGKGDLIRKINFPKYIIILAVAVSALINLVLNFIIFGVFIAFSDIRFGWEALLIFPLLLQLFVLGLGCAFFLSALFVKFRDVSYIWEVIMQAAFYATPILYSLYDIAKAHPTAASLLILNPVAQIIQDSRYVLVNHNHLTATIHSLYPANSLMWLVPVGLTIVVAVLAAVYFRRKSKYFAEEV